MIALWLATGLLGAGQQEAVQELSGSGWWPRERPRKRREEDRQAAEDIRIEAERRAAEALAQFEAEERQQYLRRLDELAAIYAPPEPDKRMIDETAAQVVAVLFGELADEFDRLVARLEFERDEEEAAEMLLLALAA